jgi:uncharacterized membrane protein
VREREWALLLHLVGVAFLFSGMSIAGVAHAAARRRERPSEIALLLGLTRSGVLFVGVGAAFVLAGGLWLVEASNGFYSLGDGWNSAGLGLLALSFVLGWIGGQAPKRARLLGQRLAGEGDASSSELRRLLDSPLALASNYAAAGVIVAALVLMVWKPGL